jgi:hypothetical protein
MIYIAVVAIMLPKKAVGCVLSAGTGFRAAGFNLGLAIWVAAHLRHNALHDSSEEAVKHGVSPCFARCRVWRIIVLCDSFVW